MAPKAVLIGMLGSGKSTIGRRLAKALGVGFLDTDSAIVEITGRSIPEIFAADGEAGFRKIEEQVIRDALDSHDGVLSLGGGAVTTPGVRQALAGHTVVFLEISAGEGIRRTLRNNDNRPLLSGGDLAAKYRRLMAARTPLYRKTATVRISTSRRNPSVVVRQLVAKLQNTVPAQRNHRRPPWRFAPPKLGAPDSTAPTPATAAALAARRHGGAER
ncbi:shikimate kinase [Mycolicibacterium brumae]|uniref:Shikimate kinase n=1 Tax=Mycolicibacterium brumae TaxID=85968 RepID=A0A2G5PE31_9MYCO|nr:shikimate kinase [Mycolicibacterium brumae]MCV7193594.1 shikimate kinase [Mycolicibacterium brumae]PIB76164.1 shikimate kinase [Mycolicibacterium brumae]RWA17293.1 hypothetical protein MBRU_06625 [Mycolicibacterium brumae DSM 44177]UWW09133.1 shikimate kinase [Mycolicibacterium brumae]